MTYIGLLSSLAGGVGGFIMLLKVGVIDYSKISNAADAAALAVIPIATLLVPVLLYLGIRGQLPDIVKLKARKYVLKKLPSTKGLFGVKWRVLHLHEPNCARHYKLQGPICNKCGLVLERKLTADAPFPEDRIWAYVCPDEKCENKELDENTVIKSKAAIEEELKRIVSQLKDKAYGV